ncbi:Rieske domain-containing protein isoform X2 [Denticeps clupeoides]|uniref:Rieske domain-containing protein n=2 Tax=Denticeps clupeoides TaxID=299321 RepID=A0AAY4AE08_9TELE|nr:Rieske domain-containing protein isoform X2 [Denticeps clupeoides]
MSTEENGQFEHFMGRKADLVEAKRSVRTVDGREILIVHHQATFYAIDLHCYHAGSSLENGDIEDINNKLCIICPKHKYKITLEEGEGLYKAANPQEEVRTFRWYSKGIKQRVHKVTERGEDVFVTLSTTPHCIDSDYYYTTQGRIDRAKVDEDTMDFMDESE